MQVIGAELDGPHRRASAVRLATQWAASATSALATHLFMGGEYVGGPRLMVAPLAIHPPADQVATSPRVLRRFANTGKKFVWCSLSALVGLMVADPAARALSACKALRGAVALLWNSLTLMCFGILIYLCSVSVLTLRVVLLTRP